LYILFVGIVEILIFLILVKIHLINSYLIDYQLFSTHGGGIWRKLYLQKVCSFGIYYLYLHHESNLFGRDGFFLVGNLQSKMQLLRGETIRIGVFQGRAERCLILRSEPENGDF